MRLSFELRFDLRSLPFPEPSVGLNVGMINLLLQNEANNDGTDNKEEMPHKPVEKGPIELIRILVKE